MVADCAFLVGDAIVFSLFVFVEHFLVCSVVVWRPADQKLSILDNKRSFGRASRPVLRENRFSSHGPFFTYPFGCNGPYMEIECDDRRWDGEP